jgi:pimeloyl-ACP methyl ester carboxylesterase
MGGLIAELYAKKYQEEVVGIVFVDSPHPDEIAEMKKLKMPTILRGLNLVLNGIDKFFNRYVHSEDESIERTVGEIRQAGNFPEIPISVISGQKKMPFAPVAAFNLHLHYQSKILGLSPDSSQVECYNSGHFPQVSEPNKVISSINGVLSRLKSANKLSQKDAQKARASA